MSTNSTQTSHEIFSRAQNVMTGGVSASMRLSTYLDEPLYVQAGEGPYLIGIDGKRYIDFNMSNGAAILGHNHSGVRDAVLAGVEAGIVCAAETPFHEALSARLVDIIPAAERVRYSSVGSEVTLVGLRVARNATGRQKYLKFDGHFHGLSEPWLYQRPDPTNPASLPAPSSGGVPANQSDDVVIVPWNDAEAFSEAIEKHGSELAAVICEPVHYNAGCIPPEDGFLQLLREETSAHGIVLIFDEVLSGFRTRLGGIQEQYGVTPDLTTHAKALANGMPLSTLSGREDLMLSLAPTGPVVHSGTYSGHLLSVLAAISTVDALSENGVYDRVNDTAESFYSDLQGIFGRLGVPARVQGLGARFGIYFGITEPVMTWADAGSHDHEMNRVFVNGCLERGVYFHGFTRKGAPGHAGFSLAHTDEDFATTLHVVEDVARSMSA